MMAGSAGGGALAELIITTSLTLDGVMQAPGAPHEDESGGFLHGGWLVPHADADMGGIITDIFSRADAFLLGRGTFDIFAAHWPRVPDLGDPTAHALRTLPKFVASRTRPLFSWQNSRHAGDVVTKAAELKKQFAREVRVHGSWELAQTWSMSTVSWSFPSCSGPANGFSGRDRSPGPSG